MSLLDDVRATLPEYAWHPSRERFDAVEAAHGDATVTVIDAHELRSRGARWCLRVSTWGQHPWVAADADGDDLRELHDRVWPEFAAVRNDALARLTGVPIAPPPRLATVDPASAAR